MSRIVVCVNLKLMPFTNVYTESNIRSVQDKPNRDSIKHQVLSIKQFIRNTKYRKSPGFTLIELLIVITIIGILISVGLYAFENARQKGRDSRRIQDLVAIKSALVLYWQDNKSFPQNPNQTYTSDSLNSELAPTYIEKLPPDPLQSNTASGSCAGKINIYCYQLNSDGTFVLWAQLENVNNQEIWNKQNAKCTNNPLTTFGAATKLNYCLRGPSF